MGAILLLPPGLASAEQFELKTARSTVRYPAGIEQDARRVGANVDESFAKLDTHFSDLDPGTLLKGTSLTVLLWAEPSEYADRGRVTIIGPEQDGSYVLHYFAPSLLGDARSSLGELKASEDYQKLRMVHELSTIYLETILRGKKKGWRSHQAPNWWRQGYEEFLGTSLGSEHTRTYSAGRYLERCRKRKCVKPGFVTADSYSDGQVLLRFFHETYGVQAMRTLKLSREPEFYAALRSAFGEDEAKVYERFVAWRDSALKAPDLAPDRSMDGREN